MQCYDVFMTLCESSWFRPLYIIIIIWYYDDYYVSVKL